MPRENKKMKITSAEEIFSLFRFKVMNVKQEKLWVIFLNTKNEIIKEETIFIGTQNKSVVHPREVFHAAIQNSAVKIILVHNHPTNDVTPSKEDIEFTKSMKKSGEFLQIPLIDHIIVGENQYFSFFDHHML